MKWFVMWDLIIPPETQKKLVIKSVHDRIAATQKRIKLEVWWSGYSRDVEEYIEICKKWKKNEEIHGPEKWSYGVMCTWIMHTLPVRVGLLLILLDSFSGRPDKKSSTIKQILQVIFSRNGIPKTLESDNAWEFCDEEHDLWLEKIGCKLYKTPL